MNDSYPELAANLLFVADENILFDPEIGVAFSTVARSIAEQIDVEIISESLQEDHYHLIIGLKNQEQTVRMAAFFALQTSMLFKQNGDSIWNQDILMFHFPGEYCNNFSLLLEHQEQIHQEMSIEEEIEAYFVNSIAICMVKADGSHMHTSMDAKMQQEIQNALKNNSVDPRLN